jgi:2,4-dienoyl-CoA reductase-like NADH-dependent reductase (Old Yellow Enzyme family)/thioredoxin reductase
MELRNRIVMPPMVTEYGDRDNYVTERTRNYYEARASGGAGLIIVETTYVHKAGQGFAKQLGISSDDYVAGLETLAQVIQSHGAKAAIQLNHAGKKASSELTGMKSLAPSLLTASDSDVAEELTIEQITETVTYFVKGALRAKKAGFDGVEIHAAHGYLIDQFLSRSSNKRGDAYGGSLRNRARFMVEVIEAIRDAVGESYPVWCRINGKEYGVDGGTTLEEAQETARMAEDAGADAIHVSATGPSVPIHLTSPHFVPAVIADLAYGIKKSVTVPVIAVGRITPEAGEKILVDGKADLIAIGKGLLADPELPNKVASGRPEDITPCIICMECRDDLHSNRAMGIKCSVNATLGMEKCQRSPASKPKRILVVGGGAAGMETARVARLRGHDVILCEKESRLGGQLIDAAIAPHKDRIEPFTKYLRTQLEKLGVKIELCKEVTAATIKEVEPDVVVLATGANPKIPEIAGVENDHVVLAQDVLNGRAEIGNRIIVIGGEQIGCEIAEFLAEKGKEVTVVRRSSGMALKMGPTLRPFLLSRLLQKGVKLLTEIKYSRITPQGLLITNQDGEEIFLQADTLVLATGAVPNRDLYEQVRGQVREICLVGDCVEPRDIRAAIADGYKVASKI